MTDESPTSLSLGADERRPPRAPLPWRNYARCFLLAAVLAATGYVAFRPGLLRFSILMSLVSPSRGESLAWKPEPEEEASLAPGKFTHMPDEWRLAAAHTAGWLDARPAARGEEWRGGRLGGSGWRRESFNPWAWADDAERAARRGGDPESAPGQKAESAFRAREAREWMATFAPAPAPTPTPAPAATASAAAPEAASTPTRPPASAPAPTAPTIPSVSAFAGASPERVPSVAPLTPPTPLAPLPPLSSIAPLSPLPPLEPIIPAATVATAAPETEPAAKAPEPIVPEAAEQPQTISPAQALSAAFAAAATPTASAAPPAPVNWLESEITSPIPGAYLTIYPKLKFIGLCVPGQGYIRKYNQIATPPDLTSPKQHAADGRTPYGKYSVAEHVRDSAGPRLILRPPLQDAQGTRDGGAAGDIALAGDRATTEFTSGGFSLEAPHMEEIFTALPNGAWVFIQE